jgi:hypothetical protein
MKTPAFAARIARCEAILDISLRLQWSKGTIPYANQSGATRMNSNYERMEPPDLSHFAENQRKFPPEELARYWGKHVAFSPDGMRIMASADTLEALDAALDAAGIHFSQVVHSYVDPPDVSYI